jgi:hypothetical protein
LANAVAALAYCWEVYNRRCRPRTPRPVPVPAPGRAPVPAPVPVPAPAPIRAPVIDQGFMDRMAKITGLTGAALVMYIIVSEGSRLFPPRNLVPIP